MILPSEWNYKVPLIINNFAKLNGKNLCQKHVVLKSKQMNPLCATVSFEANKNQTFNQNPLQTFIDSPPVNTDIHNWLKKCPRGMQLPVMETKEKIWIVWVGKASYLFLNKNWVAFWFIYSFDKIYFFFPSIYRVFNL